MNSKIITYGIIALVLVAGGWYIYKTYAAGKQDDSENDAGNAANSAGNGFTYTGTQHPYSVLTNTAQGTAEAEKDRIKAARFKTW